MCFKASNYTLKKWIILKIICNGIIPHPLGKKCVAILESSGRSVAILESPKGKSQVIAQKELKDKLYDTYIFMAVWWQGGWPTAMAAELIKHVHLINFDVLEGIWPPEERSHKFHNETQNGTNIARALRRFVLKCFYRKVSLLLSFGIYLKSKIW